MSAERFENYEIRTKPDGTTFELGRGAMGVTYKAIDVDLHCDVALKVINPGIIGGPDAEERFLREARAAAKFRHPNVASVFRLGKTADGTNFYAMEFCEGPTLEQAVAERGPFPAEEAVGIVLQIAKALVLAEQHNLIHRDLKPANLILTESRVEGTVVKVIDFGLAKNFADGMQTLSTMGTGGFAGTAHFASPEQLEESELDIRSDIFSLGICLWFMLTGRPPFEGSLARVMSQMLSSELPWEKLAGQPPAIVNLLHRMVAKDKTRRPESAAVLKTEIEACLGGNQTAAMVPTQAPAPAELPRTVEEFEARFHLEEAVGNDAFGRIFRAGDRARGEARVTVRSVDPLLTVVPAVRREILGQLTAAQSHPHGNLLNPLCFISSEEGVFVASDWTDGFSLLELLKHRGAVAPGEALALLSPLAAAADHAVKHGIGGLNFSKDQIQIHFPNDRDKGRTERYLEESQEEWPEHHLKAGVLSLDAGSGSHGGLASMATIAPSSSTGSVILSVVPALANVACELLGGRGGEVFAPLPRLSEAGNAVLRRAFNEPSAFPSAMAFLGELKATVGSSGGTSVVPRSATSPPGNKPVAPSVVTPSAKKKPPFAMAAIIVLILAGGGAGFYFGIQKPRQDAREERNKKAEDEGKKLTETGMTGIPQGIPPGMAATPPGTALPADQAQDALKPFVPDSSEWETLAANGDAFAQALLGERGVFASSVPGKEAEKGIGWLSKSANQKHPLGMFLLAEQALRKKESDHPDGNVDLADENRMFGLAIQLGLEKNAERGGPVWQAALGRAYDKGLGVTTDHNKAISLLTDAARDGHVFSQFMLGNIYQNELGVKADMRQASKWFGMAAESGFPAAQAAVAWISIHGEKNMRDERKAFTMASRAAKAGDVNGKVILAECHEFGYGTPQSSTEAVSYYEEAAGEGNAMATGHLGRIYLQGNLVSEDDAKALRLLKESHDAGNKLVCGLLGSMYEDGKAGTKDIDTAVEYYKEGSRAGDLYSKAALGICSQEGKGVPKDLKVAMTLFEEAAQGGISDSQYRLGILMQRGEGVRNDPNKAAGWLEKAANQKHPLGIFEWAKCLEKGIGTSKKEFVALKLYEDLAKMGFSEAAFRAGLVLEDGRGVPADLKRAIGYYTLAAEAGDPSAQVNLGILYSQGKGLPQSDSKALELYRKAAAKDDVDAWVLLGMMSEFGKGTARDPAEAARCYKKAADKGDDEAKTRIKNLPS